jgi:DHA1 family bicyclomycin/chloramphenicol resistance-like MFS transporter
MATSRSPGKAFVLVLGALVGLAPLTIDMYLPALPALAREFHASTGHTQLTLASYFIGLAVGQFAYGMLTDRFGRKPPLYAGLALYALASLGCALAPSIDALILLRFVQALGGCAGIVIPIAVVRDRFEQREAAQVLSRLMLVMGVAPMLAPLAGSQLLVWFGWRAIFGVLALAAVLVLIGLHFVLEESLARERFKPIRLGTVLATYRLLLTDRRYMAFGLAGACTGAGMFSYISASPFVFIDQFGVAPTHYSMIFGMNAFALIAGSQLNHRVLAHARLERVLGRALWCTAAAALLLLVDAATGLFGIAGIVVPLLCFMGSLGFITPNAQAGAMAGHGANAGSASALLGTQRYAAATLAGIGVGAGGHLSASSMALAMALCAATGVLAYVGLKGPDPSHT